MYFRNRWKRKEPIERGGGANFIKGTETANAVKGGQGNNNVGKQMKEDNQQWKNMIVIGKKKEKKAVINAMELDKKDNRQ